jgi:hypothetical protein
MMRAHELLGLPQHDRQASYRRRCLMLGLAAALGFIARHVPAQPAPGNATSAEALFDEGKKLLKAGDWTGACAKFDASLALERAVGTHIKVARCRVHEGKLASAWYEYQLALAYNLEHTESKGRRTELEAQIQREAAELEPRLPKLVIKVEAPPKNLVVRRDGNEIPAAALSEALTIDPGAHVIEAEAPGYAPKHESITIAERETQSLSLQLVALQPAQASVLPPAPAPAPPPAAPLPNAAVMTSSAAAPLVAGARGREVPPSSEHGLSTRRTLGYALAGAGVIGLGVAGYYGIRTLGLVSQSNSHCDHPGGACDPDGVDDRHRAAGYQTTGIVIAAVASAAVVGGLALVLTSGASEPRAVLTVSPRQIAGTVTW